MTQAEKKQKQIDELLKQLPKTENKQLMSIPGIYYGGGCSYMACRGLIMGGISDVLLITHGPTGCGYFSGINGDREGDSARTSFSGRIFSTNLKEKDIVFGGEDKLAAAIDEAYEKYHPKVMAICNTCPAGLIGDNIDAIAEEASEKYGIPVLPLTCEGFKANTGGWMLGGRQIVRNWVGTAEKESGKYPIHYMSDNYHGKNKIAVDRLLSLIGYENVASLMGSTTYEQLSSAQRARLIILDTGKGIDPVAKELSEKAGSGFFRVNFTGVSNLIASLRKMADFFDSDELRESTEKAILSEWQRIEGPYRKYRELFSDLTAAVFEDIFRSDSFASLSTDLGMEVVIIGPDFANPEELKDEDFHLNISLNRLEKTGWQGEYEVKGDRAYMMMTRDEVKQFLNLLKPDICFAGIQDQFDYGSAPIRSEQFTSEERGVSYAGFDGLLAYAKDLKMAIDMSHWLTESPEWAEEAVDPVNLPKDRNVFEREAKDHE